MGMYQSINWEIGGQKIISYADVSEVVREEDCGVGMSDIFTCESR